MKKNNKKLSEDNPFNGDNIIPKGTQKIKGDSNKVEDYSLPEQGKLTQIRNILIKELEEKLKKIMKREIKHIRGLVKVLNTLANEVEKRGQFDKKDLDLLKNIGSTILFKGVTLDYTKLSPDKKIIKKK